MKTMFIQLMATSDGEYVRISQAAQTPLRSARDRKRWRRRADIVEAMEHVASVERMVHVRGTDTWHFRLWDMEPASVRRFLTELRAAFESEGVRDVSLTQYVGNERRRYLPRRQRCHASDFRTIEDVRGQLAAGNITETRAVRLLLSVARRRGYEVKRGAFRALRKYVKR